MITQRMTTASRRRLRIVANDPGAARFRVAVRVTLAAAATLAATTPIIHALRQPEPIALVGVIIAMTGQVAVSDLYDDEQRRTWMWLALPSIMAATLGVLVANRPVLRDVLFPPIVFAVIYSRRFGTRATAIGITSFTAYFDAIVLGVPLSALPCIATTIIVAVGVGYAVRFWMVPESPGSTLRWTMRAMSAAAVLRLHASDATRARESRRVLAAALAVDRQAAALEAAGALESPAAFELRRQVLQYQVDVEHGVFPGGLRLPTLKSSGRVPVVNFNPVTPQVFPRQAIQALFGSAAAVGMGEWISRTHWYWAVIAAFVVFNRAPTVGHTFARAIARIGGTVVGLVAGVAIAEAIPHRPAVELPVVFVAVGIAYYFLKVSYVWTLVWFTICLALLYSIMGEFSPAVLYVRLGMTAVGAACGAVAAALIVPVHTSPFVIELAADVLQSMASVFECLRRSGGDCSVAATRDMDASIERLLDGVDALSRSGSRSQAALITLTNQLVVLADGVRAHCVRRTVRT